MLIATCEIWGWEPFLGQGSSMFTGQFVSASKFVVIWISLSDTLFPNRETAMLSRSMLNTRNTLKYIRMKGEGEVTMQMEGKYWTSNLSHLPQLGAAQLVLRIPCILFCRLDCILALQMSFFSLERVSKYKVSQSPK